jgi:cytochrome P450/NADPH-cytochrome P450 reductase
MVAAGPGITPFRVFIQDRALQKRKGIIVQPAIVFFGCHVSQQDGLYRQQLDEQEADGIVSVRRAFSPEKLGPNLNLECTSRTYCGQIE